VEHGGRMSVANSAAYFKAATKAKEGDGCLGGEWVMLVSMVCGRDFGCGKNLTHAKPRRIEPRWARLCFVLGSLFFVGGKLKLTHGIPSLRDKCLGITISLTMKTLSVKIPEALETKLRSKARAANEPVSEIVRRALIREMEADTADFAKLAAPYCGMFSGPSDLSNREGYGSR